MSRLPLFFAPGEWYHCYSRGIDKRVVYENRFDYERFTELLYLANSKETIQRSNLTHYSHEEIFAIPQKDSLVEVGAYCLMPNHFHLLLHETEERGISTFMQKLGTAYTMYFNIKYERSGGLFTKPFRARHIAGDRYFQHVVDYIHMNPTGIFEPQWKKGRTVNAADLTEKVLLYPHSSFMDIAGEAVRPQRTILGKEIFDAYEKKAPKEVLENARAYHEETCQGVALTSFDGAKKQAERPR